METYVVEYLDYLEIRKQRSKNTIASYEQDLFQFLQYLQKNGVMRIERVTEIECNGYLLSLEAQGLSTASIQRRLSSLRGFFDYLIRNGHIKEDPTEFLVGIKASKTEAIKVAKNDQKKLFQAVKPGKKNSKRDVLMLRLLSEEGLQPSELIGLCVEDIRFSSGILVAKKEKTERNVQISAQTLELLRDFCEGKNGKVFPGRDGNNMTRQAIWRLVRAYGDRAGIEKINPQTMRRK